MQNGGNGLTLVEPTKRIKAFSLVEMVMVVLFIGILAAITVPRLNLAVITRYNAETTAKKLVTDLRRARRLAVSDAVNNGDGFSLKLIGTNPYTSYEIVNIKTATTVDSLTFDPEVTVTGTSDQFDFGPLGNLTSTYTQITVSAEGKTFTITITPATGTIKCVES